MAFAGVAPPAIDGRVRRWLGLLAESLGVDHAAIALLSARGGEARLAYSYDVEGTLLPRTAPWPSAALAKRIADGCAIRVERVSHREAEEGAALFPGASAPGAPGLTSYLLLPFAVAGEALGALAIGCSRGSCSWPDELVARLTLATHVFADALARQRAHEALDERLAFEQLITDFVSTLVSVPADLVIERMEAGLALLVAHFGVGRAGLARFLDDGTLVRVCSSRAPGVPEMPAILDLPWYVEMLRRGRTVRFDDAITGLPQQAEVEREYVTKVGMRSHVGIPLESGSRIWGAIGFASFCRPRAWRDDEVQRLALVGDIMMRAFLRAQGEQRAQEQRTELAHVARVAALGELTAALAHELNQPLMAIRANAQATRRMLREGRAPAMEEVLVDIAQDATRAGDLIARLRDLLRRRQVAKEPLDVEEMLAGVRAIARAEAQRCGAQLVVEAGGALPRVLGDAIQLQQVVLNLVRNAAEAMSGHVEGGAVRIRTWATGEQVMLAVEDEGPPIDEVSLREMFTPFSTTKAEGLGIGLAISRSIVEAHGGRLWAERRPGAGLVVRLALPGRIAARR